MKCDYQPCESTFDIPEVTITVLSRTKGATWGYYCSPTCARDDATQALNHIEGGADLETMPGITVDAPQAPPVPQAPAVFQNPAAEVPQEDAVDGELTIGEVTIMAAPFVDDVEVPLQPNAGPQDHVQNAWQHVQENTPEENVQDPAVNNEQHARDVGNTLVQLFCGNLGLTAQVVDSDEYAAVIRLSQGNTSFDLRLTKGDHLIQLYFGENNNNNLKMDPNAQNLNMEETQPFLLQHVAGAIAELETQTQMVAQQPQVGF